MLEIMSMKVQIFCFISSADFPWCSHQVSYSLTLLGRTIIERKVGNSFSKGSSLFFFLFFFFYLLSVTLFLTHSEAP